ncbi:MAG: permease [Sneathiella sp.]|nr:MAG: permease [Sneathiella sp.]
MKTEHLALVAAALMAIIVGAAIVATSSIVADAGPVTIAFLRYFIGVILMLPLALRLKWSPVPAKDLLPIAVLGIFQFAVLIVLLNFSVIYIDAGLAALIFATLPLLTIILASALGQEQFTGRKFVGILLTILGVGYAVGATAFTEPLGPGGWLGILAAFASALCGAACSVFYKPYLIRYPTLQISIMAMSASVLALAGLAVMEGMPAALPTFSIGVWAILLFIGLASAGGYYLWLYALRHALASNVAVFLGFSPISAAVIAALFIAQPLTRQDIIGSLLVASGLLISLWQRRAITPAAIP